MRQKRRAGSGRLLLDWRYTSLTLRLRELLHRFKAFDEILFVDTTLLLSGIVGAAILYVFIRTGIPVRLPDKIQTHDKL